MILHHCVCKFNYFKNILLCEFNFDLNEYTSQYVGYKKFNRGNLGWKSC